MAWPSVGSWSEWTASGVTLAALGVGYWQIRRERAQTKDALEIARASLEFERQTREADTSERHRELVAGVQLGEIARSNRGKAEEPIVHLDVFNHTTLPIADARAFVLREGTVHWSPYPEAVRPGRDAFFIVPAPYPAAEQPPSPRSYGVTFRDGHARVWVRWGDGEFERWDRGLTMLHMHASAARVDEPRESPQ